MKQHCQFEGSKAPEIVGWINAPAESFRDEGGPVKLFAARPAGSNSPTQQAIEGTQQILSLVRSAGPNDLVLCMISGGGSALLVSPQPGVTLADKQAVAKHVAAAGGNILQLNTVRSCLSQVKSGGLIRNCKAGQMISLILSDVLGDPLNVIASGPTIIDDVVDHQEAIRILEQLGLITHPDLRNVVSWLNTHSASSKPISNTACSNIILGNLADAVDAAGVKAVELGYRYHMQVARQPEGDVHQVALQVYQQLDRLTEQPEIDCWISGGEPTVTLPEHDCGQGGRNQQLVLDLLDQMQAKHWLRNHPNTDVVFLSGGTDGEDGPTDAAGAWVDTALLQQAGNVGLDTATYLKQANAYNFFKPLGRLLKTGQTGTNVCDLRVAIAVQRQS